jgi:hypothetical protein
MRVIVAALLVALLLPPAAAMTLGSGGACCCATAPGARCPMKRTAAKCDTSEARTCGIERSDAPATQLPVIGIHRPALLTEVTTAGLHLIAVRFDPPRYPFATRARHAPQAPPPKFA